MPPVPRYVTNASVESEAAGVPVIWLAVTPGRAPVKRVAPVTCWLCAVQRGILGKVTPVSVRVGTGVTVAPSRCLPSLVARMRSAAGAVRPASG